MNEGSLRIRASTPLGYFADFDFILEVCGWEVVSLQPISAATQKKYVLLPNEVFTPEQYFMHYVSTSAYCPQSMTYTLIGTVPAPYQAIGVDPTIDGGINGYLRISTSISYP